MKDISDQEVTEHLKRLNRWWTSSEPDPGVSDLTPRAYLPAVRALVTDERLRRAVVLLGPRRVGKTILIRHLVQSLIDAGVQRQRIGYVEVDHPLLRGQSMENLVDLMIQAGADDSSGTRYFFFDEIQYLKDWEQHLKALVDHRPDLRILVSGSAAAALRRQSSESGAGRFTDFLLPPLTFPEYLNLRKESAEIEKTDDGKYVLKNIASLNKQFVDYVNFGGYPELALSPAVRSDPARFIKSDIVDKVLLRDLPQLYGIQDIQELNSLFTLLAYNTGEEVSLEGLAKKSGVGKPTISRYIEYLEAAFLIKRIFRVDQSGRRYQRERGFKVYLTNPAMRTGLFGPVNEDKEEFGHQVETAIFAQRFHEDVPLNYARWSGSDHEVDMIEQSPALRPVAATEIKWSDLVVRDLRKLQGLIKFCKENSLSWSIATTKTSIVTKDVAGHSLRFLPASVVAYIFGVRAIEGRLAQFELVFDQSGQSE